MNRMSSVRNVAVIGAGTMGHGIAQVFALAGLQVTLTDSDDQVLEEARPRIQANLATCLEHGFVDKDRAATAPARITLASNLADAVSRADFIVKAIFENLDVKRGDTLLEPTLHHPGCKSGARKEHVC